MPGRCWDVLHKLFNYPITEQLQAANSECPSPASLLDPDRAVCGQLIVIYTVQKSCQKNASTVLGPQGHRSHILMTGGGGPSDFFGSEILAKSDFVGSMKDAGIFLGREKKEGFLWLAKKGLRDFLGVCQKISDFLGRQILKL